MDFTDSVLVRLADPSTRADVFDSESLESLLDAAFHTDAMAVSGPFTPLFDEVRLSRTVQRSALVDGAWHASGGTDRVEVQLRLHGLGNEHWLRVDALWRGAIVARAAMASDTIDSAVLARAADEPAAGTLLVRYSAPAPQEVATRILPVAVAVLVRESGVSIANLLAESHLARTAAADLGLVAADDATVPRRWHTVVLWLLPETEFDDDDWPGGDSGTPQERRRARARRAAGWLATEGIALGLVG